ncbi:hypothetical protein F8388_026257 [Cannabis sativa]|uniref:Uncharacterized protein n=2 Tax=Cannabis sativa TaxID=3483 RepID=A0A7J6E0X6_CANSA|nr:hypothetical protein F8388_026257 [Cannabis sativa]
MRARETASETSNTARSIVPSPQSQSHILRYVSGRLTVQELLRLSSDPFPAITSCPSLHINKHRGLNKNFQKTFRDY